MVYHLHYRCGELFLDKLTCFKLISDSDSLTQSLSQRIGSGAQAVFSKLYCYMYVKCRPFMCKLIYLITLHLALSTVIVHDMPSMCMFMFPGYIYVESQLSRIHRKD